MKVILFDIDGTLIKAGGAGLRALNRAVKEMCGVDDVCSRFKLQGSTDKTNFKNAFISAFKRKPSRREIILLEKKYIKYLPEEIENSIRNKRYEKIRGIEKLLKVLAGRKNVSVGLGTGNLKQGAFIKLKPSGFLKYFAFGGFGCDSAVRSRVIKKAVKRAERVLKRKISPLGVYVVGDTHLDVIAAKQAGYHSGAVLDGFGDEKEIMKNSPEIVQKDFRNILPWLIWLGLKKDPKGVKRGTYICPDTPIEHAHFGRTGLDSRGMNAGREKENGR
ncbi:MAG: HAD hydrolase-like protein [Elusimicrobia bacterium]|nr:HAD hydrolase-like protein [Elusimicrobiota bacterium]